MQQQVITDDDLNTTAPNILCFWFLPGGATCRPGAPAHRCCCCCNCSLRLLCDEALFSQHGPLQFTLELVACRARRRELRARRRRAAARPACEASALTKCSRSDRLCMRAHALGADGTAATPAAASAPHHRFVWDPIRRRIQRDINNPSNTTITTLAILSTYHLSPHRRPHRPFNINIRRGA